MRGILVYLIIIISCTAGVQGCQSSPSKEAHDKKSVINQKDSQSVLSISRPSDKEPDKGVATTPDHTISKPHSTEVPIVVSKVLDRLFRAYGHFQYPCPEVVLVADDKGPRYRSASHTIAVDRRSLDVCRSFDKDSVSALAFIIGHELAHSFQGNQPGRHKMFAYLAYSSNRNSDLKSEHAADIQGVFNAYVAGYSTVKILPELINRLYEAYALPDQLPGYPTLEARQASADFVMSRVDTLIQLYKAANYLTALGQYKLAAACYHYVSSYYPGREVLNNLGLCYMLQAMHCAEKSPDLYVLPVEIDPDSRLSQPRARGGTEELSREEQRIRQKLLAQSEQCFQKAIALSPDYFTARLNLACVYILQGDKNKAVAYAQKCSTSHTLSTSEKTKADMALGIALLSGSAATDSLNAVSIFEKIALQKNQPGLSAMATYNLQMLQSGPAKASRSAARRQCQLPFELRRVDGVAIHRLKASRHTPLSEDADIRFALMEYSDSKAIQFSEDGRPAFNLQRVKASAIRPREAGSVNHLDILQTPNGYFYACPAKHAVCLLDQNARLVEWGWFYEF